jgi:SAM-dependent methyltransferase
MKQAALEAATQKTIQDFGEQWTSYTDNEGYYASLALFEDIACGLLQPSDIKGKKAADIGSGTGRIVGMLLDAGAEHVIAVEPSAAMDVLKKNLQSQDKKLTYVQERGEAIGTFSGIDLITSIGVLHHIPAPLPVVEQAYKALKPSGKMLIWLYGREGNEAYLAFVLPLRQITKKLPDPALRLLCHTLNAGLDIYLKVAKIFPLPMHTYMNEMLAKLTREQRYLTIYDQLNPNYAKYYTRQEAFDLLAQAGFQNIKIAQRHGYSWTVCGEKQA